MAAEVKFSQSAAVTRCRTVKEVKLKAQQAIVKLSDEEVTIYSANLEDSRNQLKNQLVDQVSVDTRQSDEARDVKVSLHRKEQLNKLVDKLTAIKCVLRFQEEAREREISFKNSVRQKRSAFQVRLARLEQRQSAERNELNMSQTRLAETMNQIRTIEMKTIKDRNQARRMIRENEIQAQQAAMRQQKESEFLRELQLCKARQTSELNDLEINNMEETEDILIQQKLEEFELIAKHTLIERDMLANLDQQKSQLNAEQLQERQQSLKVALVRNQKKQSKMLAKAQRAALKSREKNLLVDNPIIRGDSTVEESDYGQSDSGSQSEGKSSAGGSQQSLHEKEDEGVDAEFRAAAEKNSVLNKDTQVVSEAEKQIATLFETGQERNRSISLYHKKILSELKQLHRSVISQKSKEQRRRISDLLKDHEEEIEQIKMEQTQTMNDLLETHLQSEEMRADTAQSQNLLGMMLPAHIMEKIELGITPEPEQFEVVTLFFTDIYEFKKLVASVNPVKILELLNILYTKFDSIIAKYSQLYKVESVSDTYMVAAGLSLSKGSTPEEVAECTIQALKCAAELQELVNGLVLNETVGDHAIRLRIGVHSGNINAGLIGTKMSRYCLFGDTVNTASRMCTTGDAGKIQVSSETIQVLGNDDQFEFEIRGEIDVKMESDAPKFSQSAAVSRCREIKESKLKAQQALVKLADEEVTVNSANLEHSHHQLRTQLTEQASITLRQQDEASDVKISWERKEQLTRLIDKLTAIKSVIRLQHEAQEREAAFKASVREKRGAFQARLVKLEQRHTSERNELYLSQARVAETVAQIRAIEIKAIKDTNKARRMKREIEILSQQASMRQQKEMEFLRTMQLCKARHSGEVNDLEISNMEELEDILVNQRAEEFNLVARHTLVETDMMKSLDRQRGALEASHLIEKQKVAKAVLQRAQKNKNLQLLKAEKLASRNREKALVADFPIMLGAYGDSDSQERHSVNDATSDGGQSESTSKFGDSQASLVKEEDKAEKGEAEQNSSLNNTISLGRKGGSEEDRMILSIIETGNDRQRNLVMHHKKILQELRQMHRNVITQKTKEHQKKLNDLLKDHEEEIEQIKVDQTEAMQ
ncbi:Retinal guanylyl cyclase 2, partial [Chytriomyces hyalinus]